jgi:hypothetical protein
MIELLLNYSWSVLLMLIVIAILFYAGVFTPTVSIASSCILPAGFTCFENYIDHDGNLHLDLGHATGRELIITRVGCSSTGDIELADTADVSISTGHHAPVTDPGGVHCEGISASEPFRGSVAFEYRVRGSNASRIVKGDLSGMLGR